MSDEPKFAMGMVQGAALLLLVEGQTIKVDVGSALYAAELAAAINKVTGEAMEDAMVADSRGNPAESRP